MERTKDTSGNDTSDGVTLVHLRTAGDGAQNGQQTYVFGQGKANVSPCLIAISKNVGTTSDSYNNGVPISPVFPDYGKFGNPLTIVGIAQTLDVTEGELLSATLYGNARTFMASKTANSFTLASATLMRYD